MSGTGDIRGRVVSARAEGECGRPGAREPQRDGGESKRRPTVKADPPPAMLSRRKETSQPAGAGAEGGRCVPATSRGADDPGRCPSSCRWWCFGNGNGPISNTSPGLSVHCERKEQNEGMCTRSSKWHQSRLEIRDFIARCSFQGEKQVRRTCGTYVVRMIHKVGPVMVGKTRSPSGTVPKPHRYSPFVPTTSLRRGCCS